MTINNNGLSNKEVEQRRKKYGSNEINMAKKNKFLSILISSLSDPIIKILLIALGIKVIFLIKDFDWYETIGILVAIFVASFISSISEYGSEEAFIKMQNEASKIKCKVKRNGVVGESYINDIVVDDLVILQTGDRIPADGYLIDGKLSIDESSLNGETKEVYKESISTWRNTVSDYNKVYRGTVVYSGNAMMIVTSVGEKTLYGKIAMELEEEQPVGPLKTRLTNLAKIISKVGYVASFLVCISYLFSVIVIKNNFDISLIKQTVYNLPLITSYILYALTLCVTIIVVAVPEGLPMMITLVLSSNMKRMLKNNVLVRKLTGIETAGSLNILFTDKTGTLTKGSLEVIGIISGDNKQYCSEIEMANYKKYHELLKKSLLYNNESSYSSDEKIVGGNITDKALLKFIKSSKDKKIDIIDKIPFDSKNKYSAVSIKDNGKIISLFKGSPEKILPECRFYYDSLGNKKSFINRNEFINNISKYTKKGIRVLALATSENKSLKSFYNFCLIGVVLIADEVRPEAIKGVKLVKKAGIQTVMITGDNIDTATTIAREVGIVEEKSDIIMTSQELNSMSDDELKKILPKLRVVARSLPQDKSRLIRISQELDFVVGMTGDGVNDAPALKKADVGFAMGSGTEVSKEASEIVILDDNFISISKAILFGRTIFKSIRKFIIVQLTINFCAISLSIICPFIGIDTPVTVIQMLWVNMVMDTLAGLAFAFEPPLLEYMLEKPKKRNESIINKYMVSEIVFTGSYSAFLCLMFLKSPLIESLFRSGADKIYLMTAFFGLFIFIDIFNSFNARTARLDVLSNITSNKVFIGMMLFITCVQIVLIYYGGNLFRTAGLTFKEFIIMFILALTVIPIDWIRKLIYRRKNGFSSV